MNKALANILFTGFIFLLFTVAWVEATTFSRLAQFFPLYISMAGSILSLVYLIKTIIDYRKETTAEERGEHVLILMPFRYIGWVIGYLIMMYIFGFLISTSIFLFVFLIFESKMKVIESMVSVAIVLVVVSYLSAAINIAWPSSLLGL
ncbi:tripartite tricarboxylate transporter TctB family protein [Salinicoccus sp. Marseille-QA3877]